MTLAVGEDSVDIRLSRSGGKILRGIVRDESSRPVPGAHIVAPVGGVVRLPAHVYRRRRALRVHLPRHRGAPGARGCRAAQPRTQAARGANRRVVARRTPRLRSASGRLDRRPPRDEQGQRWSVGAGYGHAANPWWQQGVTFSLTGFENKNRGRNVRVPPGRSSRPGWGDYGSSDMVFPGESTFLLQGVAPGDTRIRFAPQAEGKAVKRILYQGHDISEAGL